MKSIFILTILFFTMACSPNKVEQIELKYKKATEQGQLFEQLKLLDQLFQLSPNTYDTLNKKKNALKVIIKQLHQPQSESTDLTINQIEELLTLSPNYPLFIDLKKSSVQEQKRKEKISNLLKQISNTYQEVEEKLIIFPKHIKQKETDIIIKNDFYLNVEINNELRGLFKHLQNNKLTTYQLETLLVGLNKIAKNNGAIKTLKPVDEKNIDEFNLIASKAKQTNQVVYKLFNYIYTQQLALTLQWTEQKNIQLQSLIRTALGIRDMNVFWQKEYLPTATKMQRFAEKNHLEILEQIHTYRLSIPLSDEVDKVTFAEPKEVKKSIISLLWPKEGIYEFYEQSEEQLKAFKSLLL